MRVASILLAAVALVATVVGCGRDAGPASASPTPSGSNADPWDPCTIPDDAVRAAGLRTETKSNDPPTDLPPGWKICYWESSKGWYRLTIFSTSRLYEEVKSDRDNREGRDVKIGDKTGYQFGDIYDTKTCAVALGYGNRTILTAVLAGGREYPAGADCTEAVAITTQFEKYYR